MAIRLSEKQVLQATGARRVRPGPRASYDAICTDSRKVIPGCLFIALVGEKFDAHDFIQQAAESGAAGLVVQKGRRLSLTDPHAAVYEVDDTLRALGFLARFHRQRFQLPIGAITGSNGKTTTKELVASILATRGPVLKTQGNLNNEVGLPLTLFGLEPRHVAGVLEMGMNHFGEIARLTEIAVPKAGLITSVHPAHLEGLGSIEGVAKAKGELFQGLDASATAVVNADDALVVSQTQGLKARALSYGKAPTADVQLVSSERRGTQGQSLLIRFEGHSHPVALGLLGEHNALNATGAFALAVALGATPQECVRGLEAATPAPHRLELACAPQGFSVIDDCYNANPASMAAALSTLSQLAPAGGATAVLGDMLELGAQEAQEHTKLGQLAAAVAQRVAFFGPRTRLAWAEARKTMGEAASHFEDVEPLVHFLEGALKPSDVVLVKGSRGMHLERVVDALLRRTAGGGH